MGWKEKIGKGIRRRRQKKLEEVFMILKDFWKRESVDK